MHAGRLASRGRSRAGPGPLPPPVISVGAVTRPWPPRDEQIVISCAEPRGRRARHGGMRLWRVPLTAIVTAVVSAVLLAGGTTAGDAPPSRRRHSRDGVPWERVGAGWVLAQYVSAPPEGGSGPAALYLISPGGTRYKLANWPNWRSAPQLVAWSPDGKRALFQVFSGKGGTEQLTLATGRRARSSCRAPRRRSGTPRRTA